MHTKIPFWPFPDPAGAGGEEGEERAESGTGLTVDVTLLLPVFAFELPNKSDTYLCLLLIYDPCELQRGPGAVLTAEHRWEGEREREREQ